MTTAAQFHDALQQAEASDISDIIYLAPGTYVGNFEYTDADEWALTIKGEPGTTAQNVILDGGDTGSVLKLYGSTLGITYAIEGITLRNGSDSALFCAFWSGQSMDLTVNSVIIENNHTNYSGGGISIETKAGSSCNAEIYDSIIRNNQAGKRGGGLYAHSYDGESSIELLLSNCLIYGNQADWTGGGIQLGASEVGVNNTTEVNIVNSTITGNWLTNATGYGLGAGIKAHAYGGNGAEVSLGLYNTIVYDNTRPGDFVQDLCIDEQGLGTTTVDAYYCNIGDVFIEHVTATYNSGYMINANPKFVNPAGGDYHLTQDSPCIDSGTSFTNMPQTDIEGNPRVTGTKPDIGAYEYVGTPAEPILAYSPNSLNFVATEGGPNPPAQTLDIWNSGPGTLNWSIWAPVWLSPSVWSGSSTGEIDTITASANISGRVAGEYDSTIMILGAPTTTHVPVYLTINPLLPAVDEPTAADGFASIAPFLCL
ncbi:choice-of-anchor Q domain-containing protein [Chloroflexota bacterium]